MARATTLIALGLTLGALGIATPGGLAQTPEPAEPGAPPTDAVAASARDRNATPEVAPEQRQLIADTGNDFAFSLYQALRADDGNLFYSPYSVRAALAMTFAGAAGETQREMADVLRFSLAPEQLHPALNWLDLELASRAQPAEGEEGEAFRLHISNALWGQSDYPFLAQFLDTVAEHYGAGVRLLDFAAAPEPARVRINEWVESQTEGKIADLIPQGLISGVTRLVLTNAIYFKAAWAAPFNESRTVDGAFVRLDGSEVMVPMMSHRAPHRVASGDDYEAVELAYQGGALSMWIIAPHAGQFEAFESRLTRGRLDNILSASAVHPRVDLTVPRFRFGSHAALAPVLSAMGMPSAFIEGAADFSGMDGTRNLYISEVVHQAFVDVNESGTEAAAATAVIMNLRSRIESVEVRIDRPFLFVIRDQETGTILFMGRVVDPQQS